MGVEKAGQNPPPKDVKALSAYRNELANTEGAEPTFIPIGGGYVANFKDPSGKSIGALLANNKQTCVRLGSEENNTTYCGDARTDLVNFVNEKGPEGEKLTALPKVHVELADVVDAPKELKKGSDANATINNLYAEATEDELKSETTGLASTDTILKKGKPFATITKNPETHVNTLTMNGVKYTADENWNITDVQPVKKHGS